MKLTQAGNGDQKSEANQNKSTKWTRNLKKPKWKLKLVSQRNLSKQ